MFTRPVISKWENTLTVYFGQFFAFDTIDADDSGMSIVFMGNQTVWAECMNGVILHISPNEDGTYDIRLSIGRPEDKVIVDFSDVSFEILTTGQERLVNTLHSALSEV